MERIELNSNVTPTMVKDSSITMSISEPSTTAQAINLPGNITTSLELGSIIEVAE